jgi:signal transduction histidine kinase
LHVSLEPGDLLHIVRNTVSDMRVVAPSRAIHLELPKQSTIPVMVDQVRISQVITNYLTNALKYSAEPLPVIVGITLAENEARVWVRDAGSGLSLEAQRSIWDRFRQAYSFATYTGMNGSGLGLGLYISQALIQQHGGRTGVESAPGMGSTFWFSLPLATHS